MAKKVFEDDKIYTVQEVSETLKISKEILYHYIKAKKLPTLKVGGMYRLLGSDLNRFIGAETEKEDDRELATV